MLTDSITNVLAQIGMGGDKAAHSRYTAHFTTREELMDAYRYAWLPRKLVDLPVHDALRQWRKWNGEPDDIEKLEAIEARLQVQQRTKEAMINARLFGDRKSTRLNSSHVRISYAVFCLKKKK